MAARAQRKRGRPRKNKGADEAPVPDTSSTAGEDQTRNHNIGERRAAMREALENVYALDCEIADFIEEHVKPLREDKSAIMTSLRERFGLTAKVFRARYYGYRLEREAADNSDEITQDAIRELFEVCPVTGQGSFAEALGATISSTPPKPPKAAAAPPKPGGAPPGERPEEGDDDPVEIEDDGEELPDDPEAAWQLGDQARRSSPSAAEALKRCPYDQPHQKKLRARFEEGVESADFELERASGRASQGNKLPA
jgi:hypothetical protein